MTSSEYADRISEYADRIAAAAPPLTQEQRDRLATILRGREQP